MFASNETGAHQLYTWDRQAGTRTQITNVAIGIAVGTITPDGQHVVWFDDETGDEVGRWVVHDFGEGVNGSRRLLQPEVPAGWSAGLAVGESRVAIGVADDDGYAVYLDGDRVHHHEAPVDVVGLSRDDSLLCVTHAEHGDATHPAIRVLRLDDGLAPRDLWDGPGRGLDAAAFSPVHGDQRLAFVHERSATGRLRPGIWDLATGQRTDLDDALEPAALLGDVEVAGWYPDGSGLLLLHTHEGRDELLRHELDTGHTFVVAHTTGSITEARVRPDGEIWYAHSSGALPPSIRSASTGEEVVAPDAPPAPPGYPYRSWHFTNPKGQHVHGFLVEPPDRDPPHPTVVLVHGGPNWLWADAWRPEVPAWVDHGFAVALVNYRGSTGYGPQWRDALLGDPGFPELEDEVAALDDLVQIGLADPERVVLAGGSWGGYITLLGLGRHPDRWAAGVAVVPVADYVAAFEDEAPGLKALDKMLFGGTPEEEPDLYAERSPITYVDGVRAPVLVIAGDNDSRCPIRQVLNYLTRLDELGKPHEVHRFDAGHGSMVIEERVDHMRRELSFVLAHVNP